MGEVPLQLNSARSGTQDIVVVRVYRGTSLIRNTPLPRP